MKAIILAAGRGMRLNNGDRASIPKSMENINGISIIHYQIKCCLALGIKKFVVVVGYQKEMLQEHILQVVDEQQVAFVENERYATTNTLYSLYLCSKYLCEDFIYFNADVLFHPELLRKIVYSSQCPDACSGDAPSSPFSNDKTSSLLLIEKKPVGEEEVKVRIESPPHDVVRANDNSPLHIGRDRIVEIHKQIDPKEAEGEFIGIARFAEADLPCFKECLEFGAFNGQENNYFEYAVNMMCQDRHLIAVYTDGLPCIEIDYPEDLKKAKEVLFKEILDYVSP